MSNMGEFFESITGEYLVPKKRRFAARLHTLSAAKRHGGSFRQIPDLDTTDQD
jgi:hypothetical protein